MKLKFHPNQRVTATKRGYKPRDGIIIAWQYVYNPCQFVENHYLVLHDNGLEMWYHEYELEEKVYKIEEKTTYTIEGVVFETAVEARDYAAQLRLNDLFLKNAGMVKILVENKDEIIGLLYNIQGKQ